MRGIVGPTFADLAALDFSGRTAVLASAFYSWGALKQVTVSAQRLLLQVRLDLSRADEWKRGMVNPEALLAFVKRHRQAGVDVDLRVGAVAHAKAYVGRSGSLIGSANLTVRGLSGDGHELLWLEHGAARRRLLMSSLLTYANGMRPLGDADLQSYIDLHWADVRRYRRRHPDQFRETDQDRPAPRASKAPRHGSYGDFLEWLAGRAEAAAGILRGRGLGDGSLSGHIRRHFFGFRQWFLFDPEVQNWARTLDPDHYVFRKDSQESGWLRDFVLNHAGDEPESTLEQWKTYLHVEAGGYAEGSASSGNIKRMIPLLARYLEERRD